MFRIDFHIMENRKLYKILSVSGFMAWKTFLIMYFNVEKEKASEVIKKVELVGFKTTFGPVDFVYEWENKPTKEQVLELADKLTEGLKNTGVMFNIDTHETPEA